MSHRGEGVWYPEANLTVAEGDDDQIGGPNVKSSFYIFKYSFFISRIDSKFSFSLPGGLRNAYPESNITYTIEISKIPLPHPFFFCLRYEYIENKIKNKIALTKTG